MKFFIAFHILMMCFAPSNTIKSEDRDLYVLLNRVYGSLEMLLEFVNQHHKEMNMDGAVGISIAQGHLIQAWNSTRQLQFRKKIVHLIEKAAVLYTIKEELQENKSKYYLYKRHLLNPSFWAQSVNFVPNRLDNLGYFEDWTADDLIRYRSASYQDVTSDECVLGLLENVQEPYRSHECKVSKRCRLLMLADRRDAGYLLTHRLFYLQIMKIIKCRVSPNILSETIDTVCSFVLKEAKTNQHLGYPHHDIFLEQVVFCGMSGYEEFFDKDWTLKTTQWQKPQGCYHGNGIMVRSKRTAHNISFDCSDHATGLAAAALALQMRYIIQKIG